jgi:serine/threonine-protein kinase HipA
MAKNYSLLLAGDQVRLAPLYDVASALAYEVLEKKLRFAMKIGGDYRVALYRNPWEKMTRELGIDSSTVVDRVRELAARVPDAFADAAAAPDIASLKRDLPPRLVDRVAARAARCNQLVT